MRGVALTLIVSAAVLGGCGEEGGVFPDGGPDAGNACDDLVPAFGAPLRLSPNTGRDGAPLEHAQYGGSIGSSDAGSLSVAWVDRDLAAPDTPRVVAGLIRYDSPDYCGILQQPSLADCDLELDPALAVTGWGSTVLASTCVVGSEDAPTETRILLRRWGMAGYYLSGPIVAATCMESEARCGSPAVTSTNTPRFEGTPYVAWTERSMQQGVATGSRARVWRSDDDGVSLSEELAVPCEAGVGASPRLTVDPADAVHLVLTCAAALDATPEVVYARLDSATSFGPPVRLGTGDLPRVAASNDGVYVVWIGEEGLVQEAHDTGGGFTPPRALQPAGTTAALAPAVAVDPYGGVHVAWLARDDAGWGAYYTTSPPGGGCWSAPVLVSGPFDGDPTGAANPAHRVGAADVVAHGQAAFVVWGDTMTLDPASGTTNVYMARRELP